MKKRFKFLFTLLITFVLFANPGHTTTRVCDAIYKEIVANKDNLDLQIDSYGIVQPAVKFLKEYDEKKK